MANKVWEILIPQIYVDFRVGKPYMREKNTVKSDSNRVRMTNETSSKTYKSTKSKEILKLWIKVMDRSELK